MQMKADTEFDNGLAKEAAEHVFADTDAGVVARSIEIMLEFPDNQRVRVPLTEDCDSPTIPEMEAEQISYQATLEDGSRISRDREWAIIPNMEIADAIVVFAHEAERPDEATLAQALHQGFVQRYIDEAQANADWHRHDHIVDAKVAAARALGEPGLNTQIRVMEILAEQHMNLWPEMIYTMEVVEGRITISAKRRTR